MAWQGSKPLLVVLLDRWPKVVDMVESVESGVGSYSMNDGTTCTHVEQKIAREVRRKEANPPMRGSNTVRYE